MILGEVPFSSLQLVLKDLHDRLLRLHHSGRCDQPHISHRIFMLCHVLFTFILCRVMIGVVSGWVSVALKKLSVPAAVRLAVTGFIGSMTNTVFVMGSIYLLFAQQYAEVKNVGMEAGDLSLITSEICLN